MKKLNSNQRYFVISALLSIGLIFGGYFINNSPLFTGEDLNQYHFTQRLCQSLKLLSAADDENDVTFVNVSYDKQLIDTKRRLGNTVITDRSKLYEFLELLKDNGQFKYIILDIMFDENDITPNDSALYALIKSIDKIVVVRDDSIPVPPQQLQNKSALAHYYSTITATNFVRYQYLSNNNIPYIPLKVYESLNPTKKIKRHGWKKLPIYTCDGKLCQNSNFITFDSKHFHITRTSFKNYNIEHKPYKNLGSEIIEQPQADFDEIKQDIAHLAENKYIIIGNYTEDLHDTYMGPKPGPYILYRALKSLDNEQHIVSFWRELYWFLVFTFILWWIISGKKISMFIPQKAKNSKIGRYFSRKKFFQFILSSIGYTLILFICSTLEYICIRNVYSIILPLVLCMFTKLYCDYKKFSIQ